MGEKRGAASWVVVAALAVVLGQATLAVGAEPCSSLIAKRPAAGGGKVKSDEQEKEEQYWRQVGMPFRVLETYVNNRWCYETRVRFLQCVAAIREVLSFQNEPTHLVPEPRTGLEEFFEPAVHSFGNASLAKFRKPSAAISPAEAFKLDTKIRRAQETAWGRVYDSGAKVDFDAILAFAKQAAVTKDNEPVVVGDAVNALLIPEDAHASVRPEAQLREYAQSDVNRSLVGVGIVLMGEEKDLAIQRVLEGGPAEMAGVEQGDVITHVDGKPVSGDDVGAAMELIRGEANTQVTFTVRRDDKSLQFPIVRKPVELKNVSAKFYADAKVGYISLESFMNESSAEQVAQAAYSLEKQGAKGLVLDLRGNGGGRLDQAVKIASIFLGPRKHVVTSESLYPDQIPTERFFTEHRQVTALPLTVLVNQMSASASELLSGALQDHGRAVVVGETSFGKGSVQSPMPPGVVGYRALDPYPVVMYTTTARFNLPSGRSNQIVGIKPDVEAPFKPGMKPEDKVSIHEGDLYSNALEAGPQLKQPRNAQFVTALRQCVDETGTAAKRYEAKSTGDMPRDFQLLVAADVHACIQAALAELERQHPEMFRQQPQQQPLPRYRIIQRPR